MTQLILRGFDPNKSLNRYKSGAIIPIVKLTDELRRKIYPQTINVNNSDDTDRGIKRYVDKSGNLVILSVTNNKWFLRQQQKVEDDVDICPWCMATSDQWNNDGVPWGLPLEMYYSAQDDVRIYLSWGTFCCAEDAAAFLVYRSPSNDPLLKHSYGLLQNQFKYLYPGKELIPSDDYLVKAIFGGSFDQETFRKTNRTRTRWKATNKIEVRPVGRCHIRTPDCL